MRKQARLNVGGQTKGLQGRGGGEDSELADRKIHGNNDGAEGT